MCDGILNLDKPRGPTSHDIVSRVRALTAIRRVGHAGTLDPMATGVLLICIGRATRVSEYLMAGQKTYRARVQLGATTDTYDAEGEIVETSDPSRTSRTEVEAALERFCGTIEQVPPMYSAIKHKGQPLHKLARKGIEIERKPRQIDVFRAELMTWEPPEFTMEVVCSPGTYIRSLAHDLGRALGCGAHLTELVRQASGTFLLDDAITLETLSRATAKGCWTDLLLPIDRGLADFPALHLSVDEARRLCLGQAITSTPPRQGTLARAYGPDGTFLAIATYVEADGIWRPHKVFADVNSSRPEP
jgi:tRNA pseudouridine55 synthase